MAELCNALGPRSQQGGFSFPDFSLSLELSRLACLIFLLVVFLLPSVFVSGRLSLVPLLVVYRG